MGAEWTETTLGQVTDFLSGGTPSKNQAEYWTGTVPWVSAKDMKRFRLEDTEDHITEEAVANGTRVAPAGSVLLLTRGMTLLNDLPISVLARPMAFNQDVKALRPKPGVRDAYLPYLLLGNKERLLSLVDLAGHGTGRLNSDELKALNVRLPPEPEQRAIAHILGTLDDKIELNRRMSETLEGMARALFKSWFVDFDPVRAKAEGRDPGLPKEIADLFPDRFVDSELGEIPEGWEIRPLADCIDVVRGLSYKGSGLSPDGLPMHNLNSIYEGGGYKHDGIKRYDGDFKPRHVACSGDVIVANTEQGHDRLLIGYAAVIPERFGEESLFSHHIYRIRPKDPTGLTPDYICQLLNTPVMHETVSGYANGTTVNMLPIDALEIPRIVLPNSPVVCAFDAVAKASRLRQEEMFEESRTLAALRDTLLPKLISGELRVKDTERFLAEAPA